MPQILIKSIAGCKIQESLNLVIYAGTQLRVLTPLKIKVLKYSRQLHEYAVLSKISV